MSSIVLQVIDMWRTRRGALQSRADRLAAMLDLIRRRLQHVRIPQSEMEWEALEGADKQLAELAYLVREWDEEVGRG